MLIPTILNVLVHIVKKKRSVRRALVTMEGIGVLLRALVFGGDILFNAL